MKRLLAPILLALSFCLTPVTPLHAQGAQGYAPENLRQLSHSEQIRIIHQEYSQQSGGRRIPDDQLGFYLDQINRSNWRLSQIRQDIAQSLGGYGQNGYSPNAGGGLVRCESVDNRPRSCPTPWQGDSRLARQLSGTACIQGQNWSSNPGSVWVSGGCRAEFAPNPVSGPGREVRCESADGRYRECPAGAYGSARVLRQLSKTQCVQGANWGSRAGTIWVNGGCRGVFLVQDNVWQGNDSVICASNNDRYTACAWDARRGYPQLLQTLSKKRCTEGYSWGYNGQQGLWVNHGCRGQFGVR